MDSLSDIDDRLTAFEARVHNVDARDFRNTKLQDVYTAAQIIEREQEQRQRMCNLRRIEPLLAALGKLATIAEEDLVDKARIHYLWGPIKLFLQIADEHDDSFKQLLAAYSRLAKSLSFIDRMSSLVATSEYFKSVPADILGDILEFHAQTYTLLRRGGWAQLFQASWKNFAPHLDCVLQRLDKYSTLDRRLAVSQGKSYGATSMGDHTTLHQGDSYVTNNITKVPPELLNSLQQQWIEAQYFRQQLLEDLQKRETDRQATHLRDSIAWLQLLDQNQEQESLFSRKADHREHDTCEWLTKNRDFNNWLDLDHGQKYLWLKGKPGSGKTTIATFILEKVKFPQSSFVLSCLCSQAFDLPASEFCTIVFRMFIGQILRKNPGFVPHVYEDFVKTAEAPTLRVIAPLLRTLLTSLPSAFIVLDGLDECTQEAQSMLIKKLDLVILTQKDRDPSDAPDVKILISSRDTKTIPNRLRRGPVISLSKEADNVSKDIGLYTARKISELKHRFSNEQVDTIVEKIVMKANGMFLWVRLVTDELLEQHSLQDLQDTILRCPSDLKGLYQMILDRIEHRSNDRQKAYIRNILTCMVYTHRSLKSWELCAAIVFCVPGIQLDENTKLEEGVLDCCKPLLEKREDGTISFVHFSVQEFLLKGKNIRYMDPTAGPQMLAAICIRFLLSCDQFFSPLQSAVACRRIVLGFYVLFPYFNEYWRKHVYYNATKDSGNDAECRSILSDYEDNLPYKTVPSKPRIDAHHLLSNEISSLQRQRSGRASVKYAQAGISAALTAAKDGPCSADEGENDTLDDTGPIAQAYKCYREHFEAILQHTCCFSEEDMAVSEQDIRAFRDRHSHDAFVCNFPGCPWRVKGFRSAIERDRHYEVHLRTLCCPETGCDLSTFNFATRAALKRHMTKYHGKRSEGPIPRLKLSAPLESARVDAGYDSNVRNWSPQQYTTSKSLSLAHLPSSLQHVRDLEEPWSPLEFEDGWSPEGPRSDYPPLIASGPDFRTETLSKGSLRDQEAQQHNYHIPDQGILERGSPILEKTGMIASAEDAHVDQDLQDTTTDNITSSRGSFLAADKGQGTRKRRQEDLNSAEGSMSLMPQSIDEHGAQVSSTHSTSSDSLSPDLRPPSGKKLSLDTSNETAEFSPWSVSIAERHLLYREPNISHFPELQHRSYLEDFRIIVESHIRKQAADLTSHSQAIRAMETRFREAIAHLDATAKDWFDEIHISLPITFNQQGTVLLPGPQLSWSVSGHIQRLISNVVISACLSAWLGTVGDSRRRAYWSQSSATDRLHLESIFSVRHELRPRVDMKSMLEFIALQRRKLSSYVFGEQTSLKTTSSNVASLEESKSSFSGTDHIRPSSAHTSKLNSSTLDLAKIKLDIDKISTTLILRADEYDTHDTGQRNESLRRRKLTGLDVAWIRSRASRLHKSISTEGLAILTEWIDFDTRRMLSAETVAMVSFVFVRVAVEGLRSTQEEIMTKFMRTDITTYWSHRLLSERVLFAVQSNGIRVSTSVTRWVLEFASDDSPWLRLEPSTTSILISPDDLYSLSDTCVLWKSSSHPYAGLGFLDRYKAMRLKCIIDAAQWLERSVNVALHEFMKNMGNSINVGYQPILDSIAENFSREIKRGATHFSNQLRQVSVPGGHGQPMLSDEENAGLEHFFSGFDEGITQPSSQFSGQFSEGISQEQPQQLSLDQRDLVRSQDSTGNDIVNTFAAQLSWTPGDYYVDFEFETRMKAQRSTITGYGMNTEELVPRFVEETTRMSMFSDDMLSSVRKNCRDFKQDTFWLYGTESNIQWGRYLSRVLNTILTTSAAELDEMLPFKLDEGVLQIAREAEGRRRHAIPRHDDPPLECIGLTFILAFRQEHHTERLIGTSSTADQSRRLSVSELLDERYSGTSTDHTYENKDVVTVSGRNTTQTLDAGELRPIDAGNGAATEQADIQDASIKEDSKSTAHAGSATTGSEMLHRAMNRLKEYSGCTRLPIDVDLAPDMLAALNTLDVEVANTNDNDTDQVFQAWNFLRDFKVWLHLQKATNERVAVLNRLEKIIASNASFRAMRKQYHEVSFIKAEIEIAKAGLALDGFSYDHEISDMFYLLEKLERYGDKLEVGIIRKTNIHEAIQDILKLDLPPRDDVTEIRQRCYRLLHSWKPLLEADLSG